MQLLCESVTAITPTRMYGNIREPFSQTGKLRAARTGVQLRIPVSNSRRVSCAHGHPAHTRIAPNTKT